jgi:hypothetical protein
MGQVAVRAGESHCVASAAMTADGFARLDADVMRVPCISRTDAKAVCDSTQSPPLFPVLGECGRISIFAVRD